jgi:hypothetical protein
MYNLFGGQHGLIHVRSDVENDSHQMFIGGCRQRKLGTDLSEDLTEITRMSAIIQTNCIISTLGLDMRNVIAWHVFSVKLTHHFLRETGCACIKTERTACRAEQESAQRSPCYFTSMLPQSTSGLHHQDPGVELLRPSQQLPHPPDTRPHRMCHLCSSE